MNSQNYSYYTNLLNEDVVDFSSQPIPSQISTQIESSTKKVQRTRNFSVEEDGLLVSAWLNISIDAIQGNNQKSVKYWQRICDYFHEYKTFESERNANSLMHRWSGIQLSVNKFCGYYAQIEGRQQSGINEQDKISQAKNLYQQCQGQTFQLLHCWNELKNHPKWMSEGSKKKSKSTKSSTPATSSPSTPSSINLEEDELVNATNINFDRPMGRKASKAQLKKDKEKHEITSALLCKEMFEEKKEIDRKK